MKKTKDALKLLPYICLCFVIAFGLMTIVGSGGGGDDGGGGGVIGTDHTANGTYTYNSGTGILVVTFTSSDFPAGCGPEVGDEQFTVDSITATTMVWNAGTDDEMTWTRDSGTIDDIVGTWDYVDDGGNTFEADINADGSVVVSGNIVDCDGPVGVTIDSSYLQYRTYSASNAAYRGWIELSKDGIPVEESDIQNIEISNSDGVVNINTPLFYPLTHFSGDWNSQSGSLDFSGPYSYSGFLISFPDGINPPADDYTFEITTSDNKVVSEQINYPGQKALPIVDSGTMQSEWQQDGQVYNLILSWTNPPNNPPGDYNQLRVIIFDGTKEMLYVTLPVTVSEITIPSDWVQTLDDFYNPTDVQWQVQTRSYTAENMNDARGISDRVPILGPPGVITVDYSYLQYRTSNFFNGNRGWVELTKDGIPVVESDIQNIELRDSVGSLVNIDTVSFYPATYFNGTWNSQTGSVDFSGPVSTSGFSINFPGGFNLPADDYTLEVTTSYNDLVSEQVNYPGQEVLPFVDDTTMQSEWQPDGSLKLSWTNPPGDYDQLRVYIRDDNAGDMLYVSLPTNVNEITIPSDWVQTLGDFYALTTVRWQVQTRSYTAENMNSARGLSDMVEIPPQP